MLDREIRETLCTWLDSQYAKVRIFDELVIGSARADIITVTDCLTGYEIKSDSDSYTRLEWQIPQYDKYFQKNFLVVGEQHRKSSEAHIPDYWGILCVHQSESAIDLKILRSPDDNPNFSLSSQLTLLWRMELTNILIANRFPKYAKRSKRSICGFILEHVPQDRLQASICNELFERDYNL
jgi:hypothetical protein